jgi:hypothetical protein
MREEEVFKFCLDIRNNRVLALDPACPKHLIVCSPAILPLFFNTHTWNWILDCAYVWNCLCVKLKPELF